MVGISGLSVVVIPCHLRAVVLSVCQCEFVTPPRAASHSLDQCRGFLLHCISAADILLLKNILNLSLVLVFQQIEFSSAHTMSTSWRDFFCRALAQQFSKSVDAAVVPQSSCQNHFPPRLSIDTHRASHQCESQLIINAKVILSNQDAFIHGILLPHSNKIVETSTSSCRMHERRHLDAKRLDLIIAFFRSFSQRLECFLASSRAKVIRGFTDTDVRRGQVCPAGDTAGSQGCWTRCRMTCLLMQTFSNPNLMIFTRHSGFPS